ncbi:hypothetical protein Vadar_031027 [Vaccinium darrowii]|uniref:Uncharacterized protein n=1 Tax=Vaccinium darrowii TaxID=229202 RepID=A0ACB7XDS2_9ERIC|nr:hypothetical protein Vadar_031027 [Vaccinium darrowii]
MSGRGGGRGRGGGVGGRGQPSSSVPASGGRGRHGGGPRPHYPPSSSTPSSVPQYPSLPTPSPSTTSQYPSLPTASSLTRDFDRKVTLTSTPSSSTAPPPQASSVQPSQVSQPPTVTPPSSSKSIRPPSRPGFGRAGRRCVIRANHFLVDVIDKDLHHYDVTITPEVTSKKVCRDIISELVAVYCETHLGKCWPAYDGRKSLYTAGSLPFSSQDFVVKLVDKDRKDRRERQFDVAIKFAAKADLHHLQQFLGGKQADAPQETLQVLDVVLRSAPSTNYVVVGRSFFSPSLGDTGTLGDGLQYWKGFYQSLRPTQMGLSLNVDMSARAFYEPELVSKFVEGYCNIRDLKRPLTDQDRIRVKKALKNIKVQLSYRDGRQYKISGVSAQPLSQLMFSSDELGTKTSVVQYFRERYNIILNYPSLPALQAGSDTKPVYLPMELCKIVQGQRYAKKLNEKQVTALLRATCQRPPDREQSISQMVAYNNYNNDNLVNEFGLRVKAQLASIEARVLPAPMLQYLGKQEAPQVGCWNMIDKKMYNGGKVAFWTCVSFSSRMRENEVYKFCEELVKMCTLKGMEFNPRPLIPIDSAHPGRIEKALVDIHAQSNEQLLKMGHTGKQLQLLIIILPDVSGSYGTIKRVCETELGIVSQCSQPRQAMKCSKQYLENLSLKINVKAGGRNTVLLDAIAKKIHLVTDRPTIIFGADVTHPQPGEDCSPSIAAVVASMDWPEVTKYRGLVSAQAHREEIICDLYKVTEDPKKGRIHGGMIRDHLIAFWKATKHKPDRIIFYRDGVSEGQFSQVLLREVDAIRKACVSLEENYLPRITFVVVQKRHHTRLFPGRHGDRATTDRSGNILPGTVVDTNICHPTEFDFYLCSHAGIQGTSRPTHYHVLYDENNFPADTLQMLTNNLCYTYARCTRSVSIVPPAYYAHLAAFRARYYIEGQVFEGGSSSGERATAEGIAEVRPLPQIKENVKDVMFYC